MENHPNLAPLLELIFAPPPLLSLSPSRRLGSIRERMRLPFMTDQCEQLLQICREFVRLQVSYEEYLCMKVLLLLSTGNHTSPTTLLTSPCKCYFWRCADGNDSASDLQTLFIIATAKLSKAICVGSGGPCRSECRLQQANTISATSI